MLHQNLLDMVHDRTTEIKMTMISETLEKVLISTTFNQSWLVFVLTTTNFQSLKSLEMLRRHSLNNLESSGHI